MRLLIFICLALLSHTTVFGQWTLLVSSKVEQDGKGLANAKIELLQGATVVSEMQSASNGDFKIEVPANGEYMIQVSYQNCHPKKIQVFTRGVPADVALDDFNPKYKIGGFTMKEPLYSIDYSALKNPMVKIVYFPEYGKFDHVEAHTAGILNALDKIKAAEDELLAKQAEAVKAGDAALKKKDCELAKSNYEQAIKLIPQLPYEEYPKAQLVKCDKCISEKNGDAEKEKVAAAAVVAAEKAEKEKIAAAEKEKAEKEKREKEATEKIAKEKAEAAKKEADVLAKSQEEKQKKDKEEEKKALAAKVETEKAEAEKSRLEKEKSERARLDTEKLAKEKAEADKKSAEILAKSEEEKQRKKKEEEKQLLAAKTEAAKKEKDKSTANQKDSNKKKEEETVKAVVMAPEIVPPKAKTPVQKKKPEEKKEIPKEKEVEVAKIESAPIKVEEPELVYVNTKSEILLKEKSAIVAKDYGTADGKTKEINASKSKHAIPTVLGADPYKLAIEKADDYYKMKRYDEAKQAYEEALSYRSNDIYASSRLELIAELKKKKEP